MASIAKLAEVVGKAAGKAKTATTKMASKVTSSAKAAGSMKKQDIAASVRNATSKLPKKTEKFSGLSTDKTMGTGAKVAGGVAGAAAVAGVAKSATGGGSPDRQAKETGTPNVEKKATSTPKPSASTASKTPKPAAKGPGTGRSADRMDVAKPKGSVYRAKKGDGLWQVAEKTVPAGQSVSAWWAQIKKLNSTNGKVNRTYQNTAVKLPAGAEPKDRGYGMPKSGGGATAKKAK